MIVINLPQFPFRGISAPYLWMFYKFLSSTKGDKYFLIHKDYLSSPEKWKELDRWEFHASSQQKLGYDIPGPNVLAKVPCSLMPDELFGRILAQAEGNPLVAFERVLSEIMPDLSDYYDSELKAISKGEKIETILTPINCPSLQEVARARGIPVIYFELGPLRGPGYIDLAYFDFQGLNEQSEFPQRYGKFIRESGVRDTGDLSYVRKQYLRGDWWLDNPSARATKFDVGVSLQIEDDTNLISSSNGFTNQALIAYSKLKFLGKRIGYKAHPGSYFEIKPEKGGVEYSSGTDFVFDCEEILTINSSIGLEALLWGKPVHLVGKAAYASIATLQDVKERERALCYYLKNYLVPFELVFNYEYINFRLKTPTEIEIENKHIRELLRVRMEEITQFNHVAAERDSQIASLSEAMTERQGQVDSLNQAVSERDSQIASLSEAVTERQGQVDSLNQAVSERDSQIASLIGETVRRGEWALGLDAELRSARVQLLDLTGSNSWRLTIPLREVRRWLTSPAQQVKRYTKGTLSLAKQVYKSLPLSCQTKVRHRQLIANTFPQLLRASGSHPATIPSLTIPRLVTPQDVTPQANSLLIQSSASPQVSVIIPAYGKMEYTLRCLHSIAAHAPVAPFEVIVMDDCSPDDSFGVLSSVKGIRLLRNERNQGFIRSCNNGAKAAHGEYLHFLNNDTEVTAGWMDELLRTFREFPGTGIAGSKLVYPDGRLQEAGGIIWQDGSAWNFGRFQDPQLPVYNYAREVDYCSGASIMLPKALFDELGGFDEHYLPAYCEDSDLALKIRDNGYRVIYQPLSTVIHFEGITSGTDTTQGAKACQLENSKKLFARWQQCLARHQAPGTEVDTAKDRTATRRVLVLDHCTPTPNQDAGSVTVFNLLLLLREMDFQVTFIPEDNFLYMPKYTTALQRTGIEVLYAPYTTSVEQHLNAYGERYDLVLLFRPGVVERNLKVIRKHCINAKVLYHTVDLHFLRMSREAELQSDKAKKKAADEMQQRELIAISSTDASIVHSTAELEVLRSLVPEAKINVFPLILDVQGSRKTYRDRKDIIFVGGYQHTPNVDAVKYFVEEVMPILRKKLLGVRFNAVGSKPPEEIKALASEDIIITGFVEDLTSLLDKMRVSVAPLRYGAGIKGKIGTAMAVGLPVVATSLAVEGMSLTAGENILVADGAEALADNLARIYEDEALWSRIRENGLVFAEQAWGANAAWGILASILADMGITVKRAAYPLSTYTGAPPEHAARRNILQPIGTAKTRQDYIQILASSALKQTDQIAEQLLSKANSEAFTVDGFCVPCDKNVSFLVDMQSGGQRHAYSWTPNWRERLECPLCRMNNRQRLIATLLKQALSDQKEQQVYLMEQVTPIYNWASKTFTQHMIIGSEYLGHEYAGGSLVKGVRHEDVENLSFADGQLDLIVSNDVFEHVPSPAKAFAECARVLKTGGIMLATIPFHREMDVSVVRARLSNAKVEHILPPTFHGNPVSTDGSLVFTDFGWDLFSMIQDAGFVDVVLDVYVSLIHAHFGGGQLVFQARK